MLYWVRLDVKCISHSLNQGLLYDDLFKTYENAVALDRPDGQGDD